MVLLDLNIGQKKSSQESVEKDTPTFPKQTS